MTIGFTGAALIQFPDNPDVLEAYAEVLVHYSGQPDRAKQLLRHAIELAPNEGHLKYVNLAQLHEGAEAMSMYEQALRVLRHDLAHTRPRNEREALKRQISSVRCAMAELFLTDLCDLDEAEDECEKAVAEALELWSDNVEAHHLKASLRISQERNDEALESLRVAVRTLKTLGEEDMPTYETQVELGKLLMQTSPRDAFPYLLDVLQLNDTNAYVWFLLGETARMRQKYNDSARLLRRARILVSSTNTEALRDIDQAIRVLVSEMGEEAVSRVPHMDEPNPIDFLEDDDDDESGDDDDDSGDGDGDVPVDS